VKKPPPSGERRVVGQLHLEIKLYIYARMREKIDTCTGIQQNTFEMRTKQVKELGVTPPRLGFNPGVTPPSGEQGVLN